MKHAIFYWTKTGHSKKLADSLSESLSVPARNLKEHAVLDGPVDTLFLVSGIYVGQNDPGLIQELEKWDPDKVGRVVLITSCTSGSTPQDQARKTLTSLGIPVARQEFICKGRFLIFAWSRPNETDLSQMVRFASELLGQNQVS